MENVGRCNLPYISLAKNNLSPTDLNSTAPLTIAENQPVGTIVGEFNATHVFTLADGNGSTHNGLFTIDANGTLRTLVTFDHEANATRSIRVRVVDEHNATFEKVFVISVTDIFENSPPAFAESNATFTTAENNASASFVVTATDPDANTTLVYAKSGPDAGKFDLNASTGALAFTNTPDFEANASASGNNAFSLTITVTDGEANATQAITVNVTDDPADNPLDLTTGLVAYYPFDGNASDMSGNGNHGTVSGATLGADRHGVAGKAYSFDGNDRITKTSPSGIQSINSVNCWIKINVISTNQYPIDLGSLNNNWMEILPNGTFRVANGTNGQTPVDTEQLEAQQWYMLTRTYDGSTLSAFINGQLAGAVSSTGYNPISISIGSAGNDQFGVNGSIDEVRIYDRALSESEVAQLYALEATVVETNATVSGTVTYVGPCRARSSSGPSTITARWPSSLCPVAPVPTPCNYPRATTTISRPSATETETDNLTPSGKSANHTPTTAIGTAPPETSILSTSTAT